MAANPWPDWVQEFRPHQTAAIEEIVGLFNDGVDVVFLDAPTGAGKTVIAEAVRRMIKHPDTNDLWHDGSEYPHANSIYMCSGKSLQDQFVKDFPYAKVLKGRGNYATERMPFPTVTAADCNGEGTRECSWCSAKDKCAYERAKFDARHSDLAVVNTSYFLNEANYVGKLSDKDQPRELIICDESDMLESALMGFIEFRVADRLLSELGIAAPKKGVHKETISAWLEEELGPALDQELERLDRADEEDVEAIRRKQNLGRLADRIPMMAVDVLEDVWVRDNDAGLMVLKPVKVSEYGKGVLWRHGRKWLLMSASIISPEEQAESLGLGPSRDADGNATDAGMNWDIVTVPMTFPVENRPVYLVPVARMVRAEEEESRPKMARAISRVLDSHDGENVLIHTHSYALNNYLHEELHAAGYPTITYHDGRDRDGALERFIGEGGVLLAPSLDRGIDLPGEICRVQILAKVPFPYLGDRQVSTRMYLPGGKTWYKVQTVRTMVQMTGRAVRSKDDWAVTYILDKEFMRFYKDAKSLFPNWWKEAVEVKGVGRYK